MFDNPADQYQAPYIDSIDPYALKPLGTFPPPIDGTRDFLRSKAISTAPPMIVARPEDKLQAEQLGKPAVLWQKCVRQSDPTRGAIFESFTDPVGGAASGSFIVFFLFIIILFLCVLLYTSIADLRAIMKKIKLIVQGKK